MGRPARLSPAARQLSLNRSGDHSRTMNEMFKILLLLLMLLLQHGFDGGFTGATRRTCGKCCNFFRFRRLFLRILCIFGSRYTPIAFFDSKSGITVMMATPFADYADFTLGLREQSGKFSNCEEIPLTPTHISNFRRLTLLIAHSNRAREQMRQ